MEVAFDMRAGVVVELMVCRGKLVRIAGVPHVLLKDVGHAPNVVIPAV